jgi:hypothetical protein
MGDDTIAKAYYGSGNLTIGIVSTKPGIIMGLDNDNPEANMPDNAYGIYPVALSGRVPVKVNTEGGEIYIGDTISLSSQEGVGKKSVPGEKTVGIALEDFYGPGQAQIMVFIDLGYHYFEMDDFAMTSPQPSPWQGEGANGSSFSIANSFDWILDKFKLMGITIKNGLVKASEFVADKITTKELCLDEVCIDKNQLRDILDNNQIEAENQNDQIQMPNQVQNPNDQNEQENNNNVDDELPTQIGEGEEQSEEAVEADPGSIDSEPNSIDSDEPSYGASESNYGASEGQVAGEEEGAGDVVEEMPLEEEEVE